MIEAMGLTFAYPNESPALEEVSFQAAAGEVVAITGSSGSGKSTLLMCLAGILVPSTGTILIGGERVDGVNNDGRSRIRREHLGLVFQFNELIAELSILDNVALPLEILGEPRKKARNAAASLLEELGIFDLSQRYPAQVSGGQAQRAAVARAMVHGPSVLLTDEPTGALDSSNAAIVLDLLLVAARRRNTTVVLVTHDVGVAQRADRAVSLSDMKHSGHAVH